MQEIKRFGVSIPRDLLTSFDKLLRKRGYRTRSKAVRDIIRKELLQEAVKGDEEIVGTVTMVYEHGTPGLLQTLIHIEHHTRVEILSTIHIHLDEKNCLEVLILRGKASAVGKLADKLSALRGVLHHQLVVTKSF